MSDVTDLAEAEAIVSGASNAVERVERLFSESAIDQIEAADLQRWFRIELNPNVDVAAVIAELRLIPDIENIDPVLEPPPPPPG